MNPPSETFLIAEYEALRREIEIEIKELGEFLRYGFLVSGGIWAWLLTQQPGRVVAVAYFLPLLVTVLLYGETTLVRRSIFNIGVYLRKVEQHFILPSGLGWEKFIQASRRKTQWLMRWEHLVWNLLTVLNLAAAIYFWKFHPI
jgi:hypothetical protein